VHIQGSHSIRLYFGALLLSLTICSVQARAQIGGELEADIPFQFHAGNAKLPAGRYIVHMLGDSNLSVVEISSEDGSAAALLEVRPTETKSPAKSELIFNKYGDLYFLEQLFDQGESEGSELAESRYEQRLARSAEVQERVPARHRKREQAQNN